MRKIVSVLVFLLIAALASSGFAADLTALDRIHVLMHREKVLEIMGNPAEESTASHDLKVDIYHIPDATPLNQAGCLYNSQNILVGQSFVFEGHNGAQIHEYLQKLGFTPLMKGDSIGRLAGFDDNAAHSLVVVIERHGDLTTITTFEHGFYKERVKQNLGQGK